MFFLKSEKKRKIRILEHCISQNSTCTCRGLVVQQAVQHLDMLECCRFEAGLRLDTDLCCTTCYGFAVEFSFVANLLWIWDRCTTNRNIYIYICKRYIESILVISYRIDIVKKIYQNFNISLSFRYRFNIGETTSMLSIYFLFVGNKSINAWVFTTVCYPIVCIFTRLSGDYSRLAYLCRPDYSNLTPADRINCAVTQRRYMTADSPPHPPVWYMLHANFTYF